MRFQTFTLRQFGQDPAKCRRLTVGIGGIVICAFGRFFCVWF